MRTFRLGGAALTALAAGRPSRDTVAELRRAQISRHLLLLSEIVRQPAGKPPLWYADPATRADLADPMAALHTAATLRALRTGTPPPPDRFAATRVLHATHDGLALRVRLEDADPLRAGLGLTPAGPLSAAEAADWQIVFAEAWQLLVARHRPAAELLAQVLSVLIPIEPDPGAGGLSATSAHAFGAVALSAPADALSLAVALIHETQHSLLNATRTLFDLVRDGEATLYSPWRDDPRPAFGLLHGAYAYLAVSRFWRTEALPLHDQARDDRACHDRARDTQARDTQARHDQAGAPRTAPTPSWAGPRKSGGSDKILWLSTGRDAGQPHPQPDVDNEWAGAGRLAEFEFARWRSAVAETADALLAGGSLTDFGRRFVRAMRDEVGDWLGEAVDPTVARLAEGANAEHRARWRLRNLVVDRGATAEAWRAGTETPAAGQAGSEPPTARQAGSEPRAAGQAESEPPAAVRAGSEPPRVELRAGAGRALGQSERLRLVHRVLREGDQSLRPGCGVRPGDLAYLGGDPGTALDAYLKDLESLTPADPPSPHELEVWAGIAVVAGHERPELLRARYLATGNVDLPSGRLNSPAP